jgi:hypothetical protein
MIKIAAAAALALFGVTFAQAEEAAPLPETAIILELQEAVWNSDKDWFVSHLHFPVRYFGKTKRVIRTKDWFLSHYDTVIGPALKASILAQDPEDIFKNYQGLMVGGGSHNVWLENFGDPGVGIPSRFEIITINNSD